MRKQLFCPPLEQNPKCCPVSVMVLLRDPCECKAEVGGIARIVEVSFALVRYGGALRDLCEC